MGQLDVIPALGAFAGIQYRYWIIIIVGVVIVLALLYFVFARKP